MTKYPEQELTREIIRAAIEVHRHLGPGYLESIYHDALMHEFNLCHIPFEHEKLIRVTYKNVIVGEHRLDFLVADRVVVELKAVSRFHEAFRAQAISYLKATDLKVSLILNFGMPTMKEGITRVVL
ncbi:MAG: GxxExxY protein [Chloroflexi bacterium]|nr:GxxExxY protein [Chloroflexota bacterium]